MRALETPVKNIFGGRNFAGGQEIEAVVAAVWRFASWFITDVLFGALGVSRVGCRRHRGWKSGCTLYE
eukprot:scaffold94285_cov12-Prasinocladus_malaysianus.AAC.1